MFASSWVVEVVAEIYVSVKPVVRVENGRHTQEVLCARYSLAVLDELLL